MDLKEYLKNNPQLNRRSFGEFVRQRRFELNLKIALVASCLQVTPAYVRDIEMGNRHAPITMLQQMIDILDISEDEKQDFIDLAYCSHETCAPDLIAYLIANKSVRIKLREEISRSNQPAQTLKYSTNHFNPKNFTFGNVDIHTKLNNKK